MIAQALPLAARRSPCTVVGAPAARAAAAARTARGAAALRRQLSAAGTRRSGGARTPLSPYGRRNLGAAGKARPGLVQVDYRQRQVDYRAGSAAVQAWAQRLASEAAVARRMARARASQPHAGGCGGAPPSTAAARSGGGGSLATAMAGTVTPGAARDRVTVRGPGVFPWGFSPAYALRTRPSFVAWTGQEWLQTEVKAFLAARSLPPVCPPPHHLGRSHRPPAGVRRTRPHPAPRSAVRWSQPADVGLWGWRRTWPGCSRRARTAPGTTSLSRTVTTACSTRPGRPTAAAGSRR